MREHSEAKLRQERIELFKRVNRTLRTFGRNWSDYYHLKERTTAYCQLILTNNSLVLQPPVIKSLKGVLVDFPDWEIVISVVNRESESADVRKWGYEWPTSEVIIRDNGIIDALDRDNLPLEFRELIIEGSRAHEMFLAGAPVREHSEETSNEEPSELYKRIKLVLRQYGEDDIHRRGDYFLRDEMFEFCTQNLEIHRLHMLRPEVIHSLQALLVEYPEWEIDISVYTPDGKISIDPPRALTIRQDEIIDALDRSLLPKEYQDLAYDISRSA